MKKRIYFVRHGESTANVAKTHGGGHHPLTEKGFTQAQFIADRVKSLPIQRVVTSTMVRAKQTGEVIAKTLQLSSDASYFFIEVQGPSTMMEKPVHDPEVSKIFEDLNKNFATGYRFEDEENFDDLKKRASDALDFLANSQEEHILVVTHGLFLRVIMAYAIFGDKLTGAELSRLFVSFKSENTGLTILDYMPGGASNDRMQEGYPWRIFVWNDHAHLG